MAHVLQILYHICTVSILQQTNKDTDTGLSAIAVGGIEEGNFVPPPFADRVRYAAGVSFGLFEHVFGAERDFFGFDDAEQLAVDEKGVVGGTGPGGVFFDGVTGERRKIEDFVVADDDPVEDGRSKPRIDALFSCSSLGFSHCHTPFSVRAADALGRSSNSTDARGGNTACSSKKPIFVLP